MGANQSCERFDPKDYVDTPANQLVLFPGSYANFGLYHSLGELEKLWPSIIDMALEEQAEYVDAITCRYARNPHFRKQQLDHEKTVTPQQLAVAIARGSNTTGIGNMAFMAMHNGVDSEEAKLYVEVMGHLRDMRNNNTLT